MANGGSDGSITIDTELDTSGFSAGSREMERAVNGLNNSVNQTGRNISSAMQQANFSVEAFMESMKSAAGSSAFGQEMNAVQRSANALAGQLQRIGDTQTVGVSTEAQLTRMQLNIEQVKDKAADLQAKMEELGNQQVSKPAYEELAASIEKAQTALFRLYDRQDMMQETGVKHNSSAWKTLQIQIQNAEANLARYEQSMETLAANDGAFTSGSQTAQYQQMAAQLQQYMQTITQLEQKERELSEALEQEKAEKAAAAAQTQADRQAKAEAAQAARDEAQAARENAAAHAAAAQRRQAFFQGLSNIGSAAVKAVGGVGALTRSLLMFNKTGAKTNDTSKALVKSLTSVFTMLKSRIKRMFISEIFKSLQGSIQHLAKFSSAFNASVSGMRNAMTGLSGNIAVAAGNLVNAFAPAITTIINYISQAITYLNAFFALLSGKSTMTVAKKSTDDYAKSLKGAGGAAKDLKNQVYGFDELNKAQSNNSGGGGSGGAGAEFETQDIASVLPESLMQMMQAIKAAFEAGQWEEVGSIVASGLNQIVTSVDSWITGTLEPAAVNWATIIARILNGFVGNFDWNGLGITFADGLNVITRTVNAFVSTFNWIALGQQLGAGANGLVNGIDWNELGTFITTKANIVWQTLYGFVTTFNWSALGANLAVGANSAFNSINWITISQAIGAGAYGVWTAFWTAVSGFDWEGAGATLGAAINNLFSSGEGAPIDWTTAGQSMSDGVLGVMDGINTTLETVDWQQIGNDVAAFLAAIDWSGLVSALSESIGAALGGLSQFIWGLIQGAWAEVIQWWYDNAFADGEFTIQGLLQGILNAVLGIGQWVVDNIVQPFIDGFKAAFGIASPSTVMDELGGYLIEGLLQGIVNTFSTVTEWFTTALDTLGQTISDAWDSVKETASTAWEGISSTVTDAWDSLSSTLSEGWETLKSGLSDAWTSMSATATTWWNTISSSITSAWNDMTATLSSGWEGLKTDLSSAWDSIKETASTKWESIKKKISDVADTIWTNVTGSTNSLESDLSSAWDSVKQTASEKWENVKTTITGLWQNLKDALSGTSDWQSIGGDVTSGVKKGINDGWASFSSWVRTKFSNLVNGVKSALGIASPSKVFASIGDFCMQGLVVGMEDEQGEVMKTVSNIADSMSKGMDAQGSVELGVNDTVSALDSVVDRLTEVADTFRSIKDAVTSMGGLLVPEIATGRVVPYAARAGASPESNGYTFGETSFSRNFDETMSDQKDLLQLILQAIRELNLVVDETSLRRALASAQRSNQRAYGGA